MIVGRTEEEAADKWRLYRENTSVDGILAHSGFPIDLPAFPPEITVGEALRRAGLDPSAVPFLSVDATVGATLESLRSEREGRYFVVGTPSVVADEIERWLDVDGVDGINLRSITRSTRRATSPSWWCPSCDGAGASPSGPTCRSPCAKACSAVDPACPTRTSRPVTGAAAISMCPRSRCDSRADPAYSPSASPTNRPSSVASVRMSSVVHELRVRA